MKQLTQIKRKIKKLNHPIVQIFWVNVFLVNIIEFDRFFNILFKNVYTIKH